MSGRAWSLSAAAPLLLLAVASLGIAVTFLDPNDYKLQVVAAVQYAADPTGRAWGGPWSAQPPGDSAAGGDDPGGVWTG